MTQNKSMKIRRILIGLVLFTSISMVHNGLRAEDDPFFSKSLHFTGEGMRYWYETAGGFMEITKIPYKDLDCKNCHVQTCDPCHAVKSEDGVSYRTAKAREMDTCFACHGRAKLTFKMGEKKEKLDVHIAQGMVCADCHSGADVHGDGTLYHSMRDVNAVKASCTSADCHTVDISIPSHTVHKGKLDCAACHVENTVACMNCHFERFVQTGKRKGNYFPMQDWLLLINYQGKVTSGTAMTQVYKDKKFNLYAPFFTRAVQEKGRKCSDCHDNEAVKLIKQGKSVPMMTFKDGNVVNWKGVVPVVPDKLDWMYLTKEGETWTPIRNKEVPKLQYVGYGTPLGDEQIKSLSVPQGPEDQQAQ